MKSPKPFHRAGAYRHRLKTAISALLLSLGAVAHAAPVVYDIHFMQTTGSTLPSGSFNYDAVTDQTRRSSSASAERTMR